MGTLKLNNQEIFNETAGVVSTGSSFPAGHIVSFATGNLSLNTDIAIGSSDYHLTDLSSFLIFEINLFINTLSSSVK